MVISGLPRVGLFADHSGDRAGCPEKPSVAPQLRLDPVGLSGRLSSASIRDVRRCWLRIWRDEFNADVNEPF